MKISIVIRAYNEEDHIEKLMLGIRAQTLKPQEVILVDSGSTDSTAEIARRYGCKVVPIDKAEFTFGRALNKGCAAASGDICVFASAHVYPIYATWLELLAAPFKDDRVVLAYGRQRGNEINKFSEHQIFARWFPGESVCPQKNYFCNNANCAVRRSTWEKFPYDETLTGLEDLAWAKAAQARGEWIAYAADAEIIHVHDETWDRVQNRYRREAIARRSIDQQEKFSRGDFARLLFRNVFTDLRIASRHGVLRREAGSIWKFRYNQFLGTYRGFNDPLEVSAQLKKRFYYPSRVRDAVEPLSEQDQHRIDYAALKQSASNASEASTKSPDGSGTSAVVHILRGER